MPTVKKETVAQKKKREKLEAQSFFDSLQKGDKIYVIGNIDEDFVLQHDEYYELTINKTEFGWGENEPCDCGCEDDDKANFIYAKTKINGYINNFWINFDENYENISKNKEKILKTYLKSLQKDFSNSLSLMNSSSEKMSSVINELLTMDSNLKISKKDISKSVNLKALVFDRQI